MNRNSGFGIVGAIVVVAALILLGVVGWRVWEANTNQKQVNNSPPNTGQSKVDTESYLDIKELGVKIKLSDDIKDATYSYSAGNEGVNLSTKSLSDKSNGSCDPQKIQALGYIYKTKTLDRADGISLSVNNENIFQFGDDYFIYITPSSPCSLDQSVTDLETAQLASMKQAIKTIKLNK